MFLVLPFLPLIMVLECTEKEVERAFLINVNVNKQSKDYKH